LLALPSTHRQQQQQQQAPSGIRSGNASLVKLMGAYARCDLQQLQRHVVVMQVYISTTVCSISHSNCWGMHACCRLLELHSAGVELILCCCGPVCRLLQAPAAQQTRPGIIPKLRRLYSAASGIVIALEAHAGIGRLCGLALLRWQCWRIGERHTAHSQFTCHMQQFYMLTAANIRLS
jgi:hypothetical protein